MKGLKIFYLLGLALCFLLSGCVVRTYEATKDRVDQNLSGNRGYLKGAVPATQEPVAKKTTRTTRVVEIEIHPPIRFEKSPKLKIDESPLLKEKSTDQGVTGNQGYITRSVNPEIAEPIMEKYTVQKNDTLQKISKKYYGTTKKWHRIYEANKDIMKGPNKIYPGQVIDIPVIESSMPAKETLKEPKENLK
ncbi:MAG: LysM peptidoglycan-binding domain-containing protein [Candidatus Omnitrophica bacterium]|jgi:nucleoid-associated protein YgaU|nr:LysM peptidoglycan-binding domain-containing protein [Candidatus Omnitrophota bacterium]